MNLMIFVFQEEIMYHENMRRSQLLQVIDKFR